MSFFDLSDGSTTENNGSFEAAGGFDPIPAGTQLKAMIDEASWDEYEGDRYISFRWDIIDGEHKGRKLFQKVRVLEADAKKADRAKRMLAAIDSNCGGALMKSGQEPDDMALQINLTNKPMAIKVEVWEMNDKKGNWICAVSPLQAAAPQAAPSESTSEGAGLDDIPF